MANRMSSPSEKNGDYLFFPLRHWEDWISGALGVWLVVSPMVLQYGDMSLNQNASLVGVLLIVLAIAELMAFRIWEEWMNVIVGAWLVVSPWILGAGSIGTTNLVIVGLLVLALAFCEIWDERRRLPHAV